MKKILAIIMVMTLALVLCSCGNMSVGIGNYEYDKVHIDTHSYSGCFTIKKWYGNSNGVEVKTEEVGSLFLSEGTYILLEKECPICMNEENCDGQNK